MAYSTPVFSFASRNGGGNSNGFTSSAQDSTGCDFIVFVAATTGGVTPTFSDSKGNTYTSLTAQSNGTSRIIITYCQAPTVGSGHTFTITGSAIFPAIGVAGFSGSVASPFDQQNGNTTTFGTTVATGSITPGSDNELIIFAGAWTTTQTSSVNSGMTTIQSLPSDGNFGTTSVRFDYKIQTTATAINVTMTVGSNDTLTGAIASFKAASGGGGGGATVKSLAALGVG